MPQARRKSPRVTPAVGAPAVGTPAASVGASAASARYNVRMQPDDRPTRPERPTMKNVLVFSSSESLAFVECLVAEVRRNHADKVRMDPWNKGRFTPGQMYLQSIREMLFRYDYVVAVCSGDDVIAEGKRAGTAVPRDNVVFEIGYAAAVLGPQKVLCVVPKDVALPGDLDGITSVQLPSGPKADPADAVLAAEKIVQTATASDTCGDLEYFLWADYLRALRRLIDQIKNPLALGHQFAPDVVVGIAGSMPPAPLVAYGIYEKLPCVFVNPERSRAGVRFDSTNRRFPLSDNGYVVDKLVDAQFENILVVDHISREATTVLECKRYLEREFGERGYANYDIRTAVVWMSDDPALDERAAQVDFIGERRCVKGRSLRIDHGV